MSRRRTALLVILAAFASLTAGGCRGTEPAETDTDTGAEAPAPSTVEELEVQEATLSLPMPAMGAVYFVVDNPGSVPDRLLGVSTSQAERAELHETVDEDGVMRMVPRPEGLEIPAGGRLELAPGGAHVMLVNPAPRDGVIELTLSFESHEPVVLRLAAPEGPAGEEAAGDAGQGEHADSMAHQDHGDQGS